MAIDMDSSGSYWIRGNNGWQSLNSSADGALVASWPARPVTKGVGLDCGRPFTFIRFDVPAPVDFAGLVHAIENPLRSDVENVQPGAVASDNGERAQITGR